MTTISPTVLPDTNFLLDYPNIHEETWQLRPLRLLISDVVISELEGLSRNEYPLLAENARQALNVMTILQQQAKKGHTGYQQGNVNVDFISRPTRVLPPLESKKPDHQLIATARSLLIADLPQFCAILSNDRELCHIAEALSVITVIPSERGNPDRFHEELLRKYEWWEKLRQVEPPATPKRSVRRLDAQDHFERLVDHLYSQVRAARHRTILSLAPLSSRIGLTARVIERVPNPDRRVIMLVVSSQAAAVHWAEEIQKRGRFKEGDIQIFGMDSLSRLERARAIIYRFDQMARRLPKHMDRLKQAQQRLTAIVDGCDTVDAADLAPLLFDCDQFIGFNHYPTAIAQSSVGRLLEAFVRGRSILTYSFADAERDGWGHSFDFFHHQVTFTPDEEEYWQELNDKYLRQREKVVHQNPQLNYADNFWEGLGHVLSETVAPEAAELFPLRERREEMTHLARNKLEIVKQLVRATPKAPYRRLILDYAQQWTPVLRQQLTEMGLHVAELTPNGDQRQIWEGFTGNKLDTLLLSNAPVFSLPGAYFHQLIILTPFRPIPEISAIVDWALSHTHAKDALRIDLLYVADTPEKVAMLEVAEACFNVRYTNR